MGDLFSSSSKNSRSLSNYSVSGSRSPSNYSGSGKTNSNLNNVFSQMGNFSPNFYQVDSEEIKYKYLQNSNTSWQYSILKKIYKSEETKKKQNIWLINIIFFC